MGTMIKDTGLSTRVISSSSISPMADMYPNKQNGDTVFDWWTNVEVVLGGHDRLWTCLLRNQLTELPVACGGVFHLSQSRHSCSHVA